MRWNKDITSAGWLVVGIICTISGIRHMIKQEIYGKVRVAGATPLMEGLPVLFAGSVELLLGIYFILIFLRILRN